MSQVRTFPWTPHADRTRCWALWREDLPCPNVATWRVQNTTNRGFSMMCGPHKEGFARDYPHALVVYQAVPKDEETTP